MTEVVLNVYDVTNTQSDSTNDSIVRLNNFTRPLGLGGVFHGGVQINNQEWSFGYCERGTGVYFCRPKENPMYSYRETVELGTTLKTTAEIKEVLRKLRQEWPGSSYDLLSRNCCHFCEVFCKEIGAKTPPGWVNRFAMGADATVTFTNEAVSTLKNWGTTISSTTVSSIGWMRDAWVRTVQLPTPPSTPSSENGSEPRFTTLPQKNLWPRGATLGRIPTNGSTTNSLGRNSAASSDSSLIPSALVATSAPSATSLQPSLFSAGSLPGGASLVAGASVLAGVSLPVASPSTCAEPLIADSEVSLLGPELPMAASTSSSGSSGHVMQLGSNSSSSGHVMQLGSNSSSSGHVMQLGCNSSSSGHVMQLPSNSGSSFVSTDSIQLISMDDSCAVRNAPTGMIELVKDSPRSMYRRITSAVSGGEDCLLLMDGEDEDGLL